MDTILRLAVISGLLCVFIHYGSESTVIVLCSLARAHSRTTSAVIFLLTTGGVVYLLLRQVFEIVLSKIKVGQLYLSSVNTTYDD